METTTVKKVLHILHAAYPTIPMHEVHGHDPFQMLVAVILSQRARDSVTVPLASKLFAVASSPQEMAGLPVKKLEAIIKPIGFYNAKAQAIRTLSQILMEKYDGQVPSTEKELLSLPSVGRKTANIILTTFFDTPQIAVDIHVHRITNRLGWVRTGFPTLSSLPTGQAGSRRQRSAPASGIQNDLDDSAQSIRETERQLTTLIPKDLHSIVNRVFVAHGQTICLPRNPKCSLCPVEKYCAKVGVSHLSS